MTFSVDTDQRYAVIPTLEIPEKFVVDYWQKLFDSELIGDRLCDIENPKVGNAIELILSEHGKTMFNVVDLMLKPARIVSDFALTNFTGKAAMVHFSMHPDNSPQQSMHLARTVTDQVLNVWGEQGKPDTPYLYSLYGLTPITNRAACAFVQRVGFKKVGILPKGQRMRGTEFVDAMITIKSRKEV